MHIVRPCSGSILNELLDDLGDQIDELDLNPMLVRPFGEGAVALDALVAARVRP